MKTRMLNPSDPNFIPNFLATYWRVCDSNGFSKDEAMCGLKLFVASFVVNFLTSRLYLRRKRIQDKSESMLPSWKETASDLSETHATEDVSAETKKRMQSIEQLSDITSNSFLKLCCGRPWNATKCILGTRSWTFSLKESWKPFTIVPAFIRALRTHRFCMIWPDMVLHSGLSVEFLLVARMIVGIPDRWVSKKDMEATKGQKLVMWPEGWDQLGAPRTYRNKTYCRLYLPRSWSDQAQLRSLKQSRTTRMPRLHKTYRISVPD